MSGFASHKLPVTSVAAAAGSLVDRFGRIHRSLRVSVTDACNIRCQYCMPAEIVQFLRQEHLLSFAQIECFVRTAAGLGIRNIRLTGGEPLLRPNLHELVERLSQIEDLNEIALTTNGMMLAGQIDKLVQAGLQRVNISLDTLSADRFKKLSRRDGLHRVLDGIEAARCFPQLEVKLNSLILRDVNLDDVLALVAFACQRDIQLRFIEFMPLDSDRKWTQTRMVSGSELRNLIESRLGPLCPVVGSDPSQPSVDYELAELGGRIGFIDSVSKPFCGGCDRLRLTADGKIRNCLFGQEEWEVAELLKSSEVDSLAIGQLLQRCILAKHPSHGIVEPNFQPPARAMYQIGG